MLNDIYMDVKNSFRHVQTFDSSSMIHEQISVQSKYSVREIFGFYVLTFDDEVCNDKDS